MSIEPGLGDDPGCTEVARLRWEPAPTTGQDVLMLTVLSTPDAGTAGHVRDQTRRGLYELAQVPVLGWHCAALVVDLRPIARLGADGLAALVAAIGPRPAALEQETAVATEQPLRLIIDASRPALRASDIVGLEHVLGLYDDPDSAAEGPVPDGIGR